MKIMKRIMALGLVLSFIISCSASVSATSTQKVYPFESTHGPYLFSAGAGDYFAAFWCGVRQNLSSTESIYSDHKTVTEICAFTYTPNPLSPDSPEITVGNTSIRMNDVEQSPFYQDSELIIPSNVIWDQDYVIPARPTYALSASYTIGASGYIGCRDSVVPYYYFSDTETVN